MALSSSQARKLWIPVGLAAAVMVPALALRIAGWRPNPVLDMGVFGAAILAAGLLLSWGAEAAEKYLSQGLILAAVALVTVLPEYAVDIYYAFQAGRSPSEGYVAFAAANMTGANRLLIGLAWPAMVLLHWRKNRQRGIELAPVNAIEIVVLALSSAYAFVIILKNTISAWDSIVLVGLFGLYLWRVSKLPKAQDEEENEEPGPGAVIAKMSNTTRWTVMIGMTVIAAGVILAVAEPFAESMIDGGRALGIDQFLLIQWLAPIASEAPAVVIAALTAVALGYLILAAGLFAVNWRAIAGLVSTAFSLTAKPETVSQPHLARRPQAWSAPVTKPRPNKPSRRAAITVGLLTFALAHSGSALAARAERALVLEATAPGVWRAEARRMTVEFRRTGAETDPRLTIRFLDANGEVVSPPTARRVTLSAPDQAIVFTLNGREWTSTSMQFAPREGAMLSIVEADHQHDFRLNVHAPASPEARP